ncbi:RNA degradosome polyphosphate kinase [Catellatospora coxensis]|uniref:Polyphosphate kinase n=2 Tax=Catellatospora coxensis TaxID=310354 RepID=A0A8J3KRX1_9ACTN|nr:RNA degradosome polyphosphate kinase [Catellatospora coxensis]GIG07962.1 polyphosphate kinase [Catellatospora coxensis]
MAATDVPVPPSPDAAVAPDVMAPPAGTAVAKGSPEQTAAPLAVKAPPEQVPRPHPATPPVTVVVPEFASTALTELPEDRYFNREVSWLDFNARVLALAEDPRLPLLERMKFMAIFASNLDEFFMVRIAGLRRRLETGLPTRGADRLPPRAQLEMVSERTAELVADHAAEFTKVIRPALAKAGIHILGWTDLEHGEREQMRVYFREHVFPVLTPLAFDPSHPFPYISGLSLNLAAVVREPETGQELFARVKVPNNVPRFVRIEQAGRTAEGRSTYRFLPIEELIANELGQLFSGMEVVERHVFRVTRNAEVEIDEDRDEDLLQAMERELMRRRFGPPVRLEVAADISDHVLATLVTELEVDSRDVLRVPGLLDLSGLMQLYDCDRPDLKDPPFVPATHARLREGESTRSMFNILRDGDILVHHPYHSFSTSVQRFIEHAAADPHVLAIKQTLYRTSGDSPIVDALIAAAEAGKQVVVLVEVKARFDEKANIGWARMLERAGCHVVYGLIGLKTHCKTALVVREEGGQIRRYCHVGTGNYHPKTARLYEDFGLLTADPEVGADLTDLFNTLTGYSRQTAYRRLMVAPHGIRAGIIERIEREAGYAREGRPALVQIKVNSLVDEQVIDALYRASQAGVHIDLLIRGMCALKPGVPGLSDNIRVRSILGRFLEHSRLFRFGNGDVAAGRGRAEFWIGSADMMHRNLDRRVEALIQVTDQPSRVELAELLNVSMSDRIEAFDLNPDGSWTRLISTSEQPRVDLQASLLERMLKR